MGMFDSVYVPCPKCGKDIEFQSKAGPCGLHGYSLANAPASVLGDLAGDKEICPQCHETIRIVVSVSAWAESVNSPSRTPRILGRDDDD